MQAADEKMKTHRINDLRLLTQRRGGERVGL
jgi:hypothetical protein